jgi:hypothetical protein
MVDVLGRSFMYVIKNSGPETDSCGTPCLTVSHAEE